MISPLSMSARGLLAAIMLVSLASSTLAQVSSGGSGASGGEVSPEELPAPPRPEAPRSPNLGSGGAMGSGMPDDVVQSGDSGGFDLPPDPGDSEDEDSDVPGGGTGDIPGDGTGGGHVATPAGLVVAIQVTITDSSGTIVRHVRLQIQQRRGRLVVLGATGVTPQEHGDQPGAPRS